MARNRRIPTVIDLFCGAGGLTAALETAGWTTIAAADHDRTAMATLRATQAARVPIPGRPDRTYLDGARLVCGDVTRLGARDLRPEGAGSRWRPDLLAGGPPCQPFSSAGRMLGLEDERGTLMLDFVRLAAELRPRFVLFENVRGLLTARDREGRPGGVLKILQHEFEGVGYACRFAVLNAADYGAPQRRVRLYMLASQEENLPDFPEPTHSRAALAARQLDAFGEAVAGPSPWVTLREVLAARAHLPVDPNDVVRPSPARAAELHTLEPGTGIRSNGIVEGNRPSGHWGYRQDCFLADPTMPSRTIRAAATPDWVRDPDGSLRRLTWRECAALQGFPEGWAWQGGVAPRFRQIGNAVQGQIGLALGRALLAAALKRPRKMQVHSPPWPDEFHRRVAYTAMEERVNGHSRRVREVARAAYAVAGLPES